jgi:hypothetical protein
MADLPIDSRLLEKWKQTAQERSMSVNEFLEKAVQSYLRELEAKELQRNIEAFGRLYPDLVKGYFGEYVAIHAGKLVDHDADFPILHKRVRQQYGRQPVLLRRVTQEDEPVWTFRSPRLDRGSY